MLIILLVIIEIVLSVRSATLGLSFYFALRLCVPPSARLAGVSVNTFLLLIFILCLFLFHSKLCRIIPRLFSLHGRYILFLFFSLFALTFFAQFVPLQYQHKELIQFFITELFPCLLIPLVIRNKKDYKTIFFIIAFASLFNVCYGLLTYIINANPILDVFASNIDLEELDPDFALSEEGRYGLTRKAIGIYSDKIFMALVSLLIYIYFYGKEFVNKRLRISLLLISAVTCFFTTQRTSLFCLVIFLAIVIDKRTLKLYIKKYFLFLCVCFVILLTAPQFKVLRDFAYSAFYIFDDKKQEQVDIGGSSVSVRVAQLESVVELVGSDILPGFGYGFASYREGTSINVKEMYGLESYALKIVANSGLLGFLFWLCFFYKLVRSSISIHGKNKKYIIAFNISYLLAILMTDTSGSFYLFFVFLELNCVGTLLWNKKDEHVLLAVKTIKENR